MDLPHVAQARFRRLKRPHLEKDMSFGNPPHHGTKIADFSKISIFIFYFYWSKSGILGQKNGVLGCLGPGVR